MRLLALLALLFLVWTPLAAAQSGDAPANNRAETVDAPRGMLKKPKPTDSVLLATPDQIDEALQVTQDCQAASFSTTFFDCDCVGMKFLENRLKYGEQKTSVYLLTLSRKSCPNSAGLAGSTLTQCETWAAPMRPRDFKPFCACFANRLGRTYERNPSMNEMVREYQMTEAFSFCDHGSFGQGRIDRDNTIRDLIKQGLYDKLFPSAAEDRKASRSDAEAPSGE